MFEVNLDTDRGRAVVQEGTVWLPADVRDFLGGALYLATLSHVCLHARPEMMGHAKTP
jgi:hypothetical protein